MELQGNENLLGSLSSQGTLYIFEREKNIRTIQNLYCPKREMRLILKVLNGFL